MDITLSAAPAAETDADVLVLPVFEGADGPVSGPGVAEAGLDGLPAAARLSGKPEDELLILRREDDRFRAGAVLLIGLGPAEQATTDTVRRASARAVRQLARFDRVVLGLSAAVPGSEGAAAEGALLGGYRYDGHREPGQSVGTVLVAGAAGAERAVREAVVVAESVAWARDLANAPAGELTPAVLADRAREMAEEVGLGIRVLDEHELAAGGYGGILGVGQGSTNPPRLIEVRYPGTAAEGTGGGAAARTVGLVGKGITFDAGGLGIKSGAAMADMRSDMCGGAAMLAGVRAAALLGTTTGVIAVVPTAENLLGGSAYKPGDVLRHRNGKTSEVLDTDAEGRLILADALAHVAEARPDVIIDAATLTYAVMQALGDQVSGLLGNDRALVGALLAAAEEVGEPLWELPLHRGYLANVTSTVADLKNDGGPLADAIHAGLYLEQFTDGIPWAHLDIAGTAWAGKAADLWPTGATGVAIRTLVHYLTRN